MLDLVQKSPASSFQRYIYAPTHNILGGSDGKASAYSAGDPGSNPWVGKIPWRRKWPSAPVFLPGECHGWRSLVGSPWGRKESDMTESFPFFLFDPPEAPCHLLPHPIPLSYHRNTALTSLGHPANSSFLSVSHVVMYTPQRMRWLGGFPDSMDSEGGQNHCFPLF